MEIRLDSHIALITGAGRNIGRAIAVALAEAGAAVAINVKTNREEAEKVARGLRKRGMAAKVVVGDVGDRKAVEEIFSQTEKMLGPITILINNASIRPRQEFMSITCEEWETVLRTNLGSAFYCSQRALPGMLRRRYGRIINVSGVDAYQPFIKRAHSIASKAGILGLTKALAFEFGPKGITTNAIVPGAFNTKREASPVWTKLGTVMNEACPVRRLGDPSEVGRLCVYLASESASYVNGQAIHINGGMLMV